MKILKKSKYLELNKKEIDNETRLNLINLKRNSEWLNERDEMCALALTSPPGSGTQYKYAV